MKKNTIISWVVSLLMLAFLASCADESPVNSLEEEIADDKYDVQTEINSDKNNYYSSSSSKKYSSSSYVSESEKCRLGTSSKPDSYCCSYYGYQCVALQEAKTLHFTVTDYYQGSYEWDGLDDPGDPKIYFNIYTYKNGAKDQSLSTGYLLELKNKTAWSGTKSVALTINSGVDSLEVCPRVIDEDVLSNDNYSSGYCFLKGKLGKLDDYRDVYQYDEKTNKYSLYWQWYLY
ncbi:MAG: hypothetical protein UHC59_06875 [Fibrobacteraceae bacterium]|nr:hypothetical protein [Fibrobacteraceae bacterium]